MVAPSPKEDTLPTDSSEVNDQALQEQHASENPTADSCSSTAAQPVEEVEPENILPSTPEQPTCQNSKATDNQEPTLINEEPPDLDSVIGADSQAENDTNAQQNTDDTESRNDAKPGFVRTHLKQIVIGIAVIAIIVIGTVVGVPAYHLWQGNQALESGEYMLAAEAFENAELLGGHDRIRDTAEACMETGQYDTAAEIFAMDGSNSSKRYVAFCNGMAALKREDYATAVDELNGLTVEGAAEAYAQASYLYGQELVANDRYEDALMQFKNAGEYEDAPAWITRCENTIAFDNAEALYQSGDLPAAQRAFSNLPNSFERDGVTVAQRQQALKDHQAFVDMCGDYSLTSGECEVRQTHKSSGRWYNWTADLADSWYNANISCHIEDDGSVTISGSASFYRYTSFSSISEGLDGTDDTVSFSFNTSVLPDSVDIGSNCKLSYSNGTLTLNYYRVDQNEDLYFDYLYRTDVAYSK